MINESRTQLFCHSSQRARERDRYHLFENDYQTNFQKVEEKKAETCRARHHPHPNRFSHQARRNIKGTNTLVRIFWWQHIGLFLRQCLAQGLLFSPRTTPRKTRRKLFQLSSSCSFRRPCSMSSRCRLSLIGLQIITSQKISSHRACRVFHFFRRGRTDHRRWTSRFRRGSVDGIDNYQRSRFTCLLKETSNRLGYLLVDDCFLSFSWPYVDRLSDYSRTVIEDGAACCWCWCLIYLVGSARRIAKRWLLENLCFINFSISRTIDTPPPPPTSFVRARSRVWACR